MPKKFILDERMELIEAPEDTTTSIAQEQAATVETVDDKQNKTSQIDTIVTPVVTYLNAKSRQLGNTAVSEQLVTGHEEELAPLSVALMEMHYKGEILDADWNSFVGAVKKRFEKYTKTWETKYSALSQLLNAPQPDSDEKWQTLINLLFEAEAGLWRDETNYYIKIAGLAFYVESVALEQEAAEDSKNNSTTVITKAKRHAENFNKIDGIVSEILTQKNPENLIKNCLEVLNALEIGSVQQLGNNAQKYRIKTEKRKWLSGAQADAQELKDGATATELGNTTPQANISANNSENTIGTNTSQSNNIKNPQATSNINRDNNEDWLKLLRDASRHSEKEVIEHNKTAGEDDKWQTTNQVWDSYFKKVWKTEKDGNSYKGPFRYVTHLLMSLIYNNGFSAAENPGIPYSKWVQENIDEKDILPDTYGLVLQWAKNLKGFGSSGTGIFSTDELLGRVSVNLIRTVDFYSQKHSGLERNDYVRLWNRAKGFFEQTSDKDGVAKNLLSLFYNEKTFNEKSSTLKPVKDIKEELATTMGDAGEEEKTYGNAPSDKQKIIQLFGNDPRKAKVVLTCLIQITMPSATELKQYRASVKDLPTSSSLDDLAKLAPILKDAGIKDTVTAKRAIRDIIGWLKEKEK